MTAEPMHHPTDTATPRSNMTPHYGTGAGPSTPGAVTSSPDRRSQRKTRPQPVDHDAACDIAQAYEDRIERTIEWLAHYDDGPTGAVAERATRLLRGEA